MPDQQADKKSPILSPEEIEFLIKNDGISMNEIWPKLTSQERVAWAKAETAKTFGSDLAPFMPGNVLQGAVGAAGKSVLSKVSLPSMEGAKQLWNKVAPQATGALGAGLGKTVGHPWAGWNAGHELGKRLKFKPTPFKSSATKEGLGRVPEEGGGIVKGSGKPAIVTSNVSHHAGDARPNVQKVGRSEFTETEKRAKMFGGVGEGTKVKPGAKGPASFKGIEDDSLSEAEKLIQEIMKGKTGGSLPNNARRGAVLKSPKKK